MEFNVKDIVDAPVALAEAIVYQQENEQPVKLLTHTSGWLTSAYAELNSKQAITFLNEAWESGQRAIDTYEWIESGELTVKVEALNFGIVIGVNADVVRDADSQAKQEKQTKLIEELYGESE